MDKLYYKHKMENLVVVNKIVTIHYFEFSKHFIGPSEAHDFWELVYADKGSIICQADGAEIPLNEGEMLFHKPNEQHALRANGQTSPNVFIVSFECKSEAIKFFENRKLTVSKSLIKFIYAIIDESKKTFDLPYADPRLRKMKLLPSPTLGGQQLIKNYLEILLVNLMRLETEKKDANAIFLPQEEYNEHIAKEVKEFLHEHIYEKISIQDVCNAIHYNKSYIFHQFKQATGCSVMAYFIKLKIQQAKNLLRDGKLSITEIADKLSFDTPNYFSKTFKKLTGYAPLQYRKIVVNV